MVPHLEDPKYWKLVFAFPLSLGNPGLSDAAGSEPDAARSTIYPPLLSGYTRQFKLMHLARVGVCGASMLALFLNINPAIVPKTSITSPVSYHMPWYPVQPPCTNGCDHCALLSPVTISNILLYSDRINFLR